MQLKAPGETPICEEPDIYNSELKLDGCNILDLGCGDGRHSVTMAGEGTGRTITAMEIDKVQLAKNLQTQTPDNLTYKYGSAAEIPADDASFDVVFMFRSMHHVPLELMAKAMNEVHRVLKPGGYAYFTEPVYDGELDEIWRIFHDEKQMREAAFATIKGAVDDGRFALVKQIFYNNHRLYRNFERFKQTFMGLSYNDYNVTDEVLAKVKAKFEQHLQEDGAHFYNPNRVDLLQKL